MLQFLEKPMSLAYADYFIVFFVLFFSYRQLQFGCQNRLLMITSLFSSFVYLYLVYNVIHFYIEDISSCDIFEPLVKMERFPGLCLFKLKQNMKQLTNASYKLWAVSKPSCKQHPVGGHPANSFQALIFSHARPDQDIAEKKLIYQKHTDGRIRNSF